MESIALPPQPVASPDWRRMAASPLFVPVLAALIGLGAMFFNLVRGLPALWMTDEYYSHGFLIPILAGYVVWQRWPRLRELPARSGWAALILLIPLVLITRAAILSDIPQLVSVCFLAALVLAIWFIAGARWMAALLAPALFLVFMLPLWSGAIDVYTNPLQLASTKVAYHVLNLSGFSPIMSSPTEIYLDRFTLNVEVPCSGLKLMLALTAFTLFFLMIADLRWWGRLAMIAFIVPLCLFINGLRIALIGMVGNAYGQDAGLSFHDYSGYITLLVCFFILFWVARRLGWKG